MQFQKDLETFISSKHLNSISTKGGQGKELFLKKNTDSSCLTIIYTPDFFRIWSCGYLKVTALLCGDSCVFSLNFCGILCLSLHSLDNVHFKCL